MKLSNKAYDTLKFVAMIVLPALSAMYLGLGQIWGWSNVEQVVASLVMLDTFLGAVLQVNSAKYKNDPTRVDGFLGTTGADPDTGIPNLQLVLTTSPDELLSGKTARLKIGAPPQ